MAKNRIAGINIKFGADTTGLDKALNSIERESKNVKSELSEVNRTIKTAPESAELWRQKQELLTKAVEESRKKVEFLEDTQKQVQKQFENKEIDNGAYRAFQRELEKARAESDELGKQLETTTEKISGAGKKSEDAFERTKNELKEVEKALKDAPKSVELWRQKQELLSVAFAESRKNVRSLEDAQKQIRKQFENKEIDDGAYRTFQRELEKACAESKNLEEQLENTGKKIYDLENGTENGIKSTDKLGDSMEDTGKKADNMGDEIENAGEQAENSSDGFTVLKGTLANLATDGIRKVVDAMKDSIEQAQAYEDSIAKLSTIADESVSIEKLSDDIMELSDATGITADELASTTYDAISAGQSTENAVEFVEKATDLARAGFADTANTIDLLTTILNAYGLESEKVTEVSDMLIQTQNKGKTTVAELSSAMGKVIPTANACGVGLDQLAAAYAVMTSNGVATAETTTYLNSMLNELSKSGTKSSDILKEKTGKSFQELMADGKSLSEVLEIINEAAVSPTVDTSAIEKAENKIRTQKLNVENAQIKLNTAIEKYGENSSQAETAANNLEKAQISLQTAESDLIGLQEEQNKSFNDMWGSAEAGKAGLILLGDGAENYNKVLGEMQNSTGATETALEKLNTSSYQFEKAQNKVKNTLIAIGSETMESVMPILEKYLPKGLDVLRSFNENLPEMKQKIKDMIPQITGVTTGLIAWKATGKISGVIDSVKKLGDTFKNVSSMAGLATTGVVGIVAALTIGAASYLIAAKKAEEAKLDRVFQEAKGESEKLSDAIKDNADKLSKMKEEAEKNIEADDIMIDRTKRLYDELQTLVDNNGKVKKGYEDRVKYITGELTEATGVEIDLIDGQIQKYGELKTSIENAIEKQRAMALQSGYNGVYMESLMQNETAAAEMQSIKDDIAERQAIIDRFKNQQLSDKVKNSGYFEITKEDISEGGQYYYDFNERQRMEMLGAFEGIEIDKKSLEDLAAAYKERQADIEAYEEASALLAEGSYKDAKKLYEQIKNENTALIRDCKGTVEEIVSIARTNIQNAVQTYENNVELGNRHAKEDFLETLANISKSFKDEGVKIPDYVVSPLIQRLESIDGFDYTMLKEFCEIMGLDLGETIGYITGEKAKEIALQRMYENMPEFIDSLGEATGNYGPAMNWDPINKKRLTPYATGGYISAGNKGIVAESGPELIEAMNGGIRITPLTGDAWNTPVSAASGGQKVFYNTYNINNPRISSNMDVRKIAQELAAEQRRIENGKGL